MHEIETEVAETRALHYLPAFFSLLCKTISSHFVSRKKESSPASTSNPSDLALGGSYEEGDFSQNGRVEMAVFSCKTRDGSNWLAAEILTWARMTPHTTCGPILWYKQLWHDNWQGHPMSSRHTGLATIMKDFKANCQNEWHSPVSAGAESDPKIPVFWPKDPL